MLSGRRPPSPAAGSECTLSVAELNRQARLLLEGELGELWVEGEISGLSRPASGHVYFTLKDDRAQVRCALFRNRARFVGAPMREGDQIRVRAKLSIFEPRGDYQLIVEAVQGAGRGAMLAALEALKQRLQGEGVFANARPLPYPPRHLGIITSGSGAAIHDVLNVLRARWPLLAVSVLPVPVQGAEASAAIIRAIALANRDARFDALLLTRGGGSLEDLWCFNDEHLARAIFHSRLPVMSAVGHEVDFTLADFAADVRAPTPSVAAELLVPDRRDLLARIGVLHGRLRAIQGHRLRQAMQRADRAALRLQAQSPQNRLRLLGQRQEALRRRLEARWREQLQHQHARLRHAGAVLRAHHPQRRVAQLRERLLRLQSRPQAAIARILQRDALKLRALARSLEACSPLATVARGYSIVTRGDDGALVHSVAQVAPGDRVQARLRDGTVALTVGSVTPDPPSRP